MGLGPVGFVDLFGDEGNYLSDLVYAKINGVEHGVLASALVGGVGVSRCITLLQNYPNPFNPSTTISYALPQRSHVTLTVFNTLGQQIANVVNGVEEPGEHSVRFDGSGLTSGVYFYQMRAGGYMATKRLLLLR